MRAGHQGTTGPKRRCRAEREVGIRLAVERRIFVVLVYRGVQAVGTHGERRLAVAVGAGRSCLRFGEIHIGIGTFRVTAATLVPFTCNYILKVHVFEKASKHHKREGAPSITTTYKKIKIRAGPSQSISLPLTPDTNTHIFSLHHAWGVSLARSSLASKRWGHSHGRPR